MKKVLFIMLVCLCFTGISFSPAIAAENGQHYVNGVEGIKCGSLPGPGLYYKMYNAFYKSDTMKNPDGDKVDYDFDLTVFANVHRLVWVTECKPIKGDFAASVIIPVQYTDVEVTFPNYYPPPPQGPASFKQDTFAIGDPYAEFVLSWHGSQWDSAVGAGLYFPFGDYDEKDSSTPGEDMWTLMLNYAGTYFIDTEKTWSASILARYETHTEKSDTKVNPGDNFHFEWGVGKILARIWDVGVAGYCNWQVTEDSGSGSQSDDKDKVNAIGPEVAVFLPPYKLQISLRSQFEFGAEDRQEGNITTLTFSKIF